VTDYSFLHDRFDSTYRLGRCRQSHGRPAFAWKASLGLRLDDGMRCPKCHHLLERTSRDVHNLRELTEDETLYEFETALKSLREKLARSNERTAEWEACMPSPQRTFTLQFERETRTRVERDLHRVERGFRRWTSSGSDQHDEAVQSGR